MSELKISVCIPCCDRHRLTREAVLSCLEQDPKPHEILVGDDSRDDQTRHMLESMDFGQVRLRYFANSPGLGQGRNVQRLFLEAEGDVISLLHDDDRFKPGAFAALSDPLKKHPEVSASFGKQAIINLDGVELPEETKKLNHAYGRFKYMHGTIANSFEAGAIAMFPNDGYFVRAELAKSIDYFANGVAFNACDYFFGFRLGLLEKPFFFVGSVLCEYRITPNSVGRSGSDSAFYAVKLLMEHAPADSFTPAIHEMLRRKIKTAIYQGAAIDRRLCWSWFFSKWHRGSILTFGGIRRLFILLGI